MHQFLSIVLQAKTPSASSASSADKLTKLIAAYNADTLPRND
jgi:hypothetical protein